MDVNACNWRLEKCKYATRHLWSKFADHPSSWPPLMVDKKHFYIPACWIVASSCIWEGISAPAIISQTNIQICHYFSSVPLLTPVSNPFLNLIAGEYLTSSKIQSLLSLLCFPPSSKTAFLHTWVVTTLKVFSWCNLFAICWNSLPLTG